MLPAMARSGEFASYARVCETGEPYVEELTFDVPVGEGHIQGTLTRRVAKFGDGLIVLVTDVTTHRRTEAELRAYADMVAHDLVDGADGCVVTVRDNGVGVDPGHAGRIFRMFARGRGDTEGTGIGLAICRRVVEAHGGHIWVEPAEGGGSAFSFTLPC
jgi:signal transduction histidine kinase